MRSEASLETINPSVLAFRGLDSQALVALQMRNLEALRQLAVLALEGAELIAKRQMEIVEGRVDDLNRLPPSADGDLDLPGAFAKQAAMFGQVLGMLTADTRELTELSCKCGGHMIKQVSTALSDQPSPGRAGSERARAGSKNG